jgi:hypothetical protein
MQRYINDGLWNPWPYKVETRPSVGYDRKIAISKVGALSEGHAKVLREASSTDSDAAGYV